MTTADTDAARNGDADVERRGAETDEARARAGEVRETVPVTLYTTRGCRPCSLTKSFLEERGVEYEEIDLSGVDDPRAELADLTGGSFVTPVVVVGSRVGIGYDPDWLGEALPGDESAAGAAGDRERR